MIGRRRGREFVEKLEELQKRGCIYLKTDGIVTLKNGSEMIGVMRTFIHVRQSCSFVKADKVRGVSCDFSVSK